MKHTRSIQPFLASAFAVVVGGACLHGQTEVVGAPDAQSEMALLKMEVAKLRIQNQTLASTIVDAKQSEAKITEELNDIKQRLAALGKNLLDGGNDRLVQAASDLQVMQERLNATEKAAFNIATAAQNYANDAVVSNPQLRLKLEVSIRELDSTMGLIQKPQPDVKSGSIHRAEIVSIDSESGLLLINSGTNQNLKIGMNYSIQRGQQTFGKAIIAEVRQNVAGAFVEQLHSPDQQIQIGDTLVLNTESR